MYLSLMVFVMCTGYTAANMNWYNNSVEVIPASHMESSSLDIQEVRLISKKIAGWERF